MATIEQINDTTLYVSGNEMKLADMKRVLGAGITTIDDEVDEIQANPLSVSKDKIRKIYDKQKTAVGCEDTSFGFGATASMVKHLIKDCKENGSELYDVLRALAPKAEYVNYNSIVSFKDGTDEVHFHCTMKCYLCARTAPGMIDPFAIPVKYTIEQHLNGVKTVLVADEAIYNPDKLSIAQQPDNRPLVHARYFALGVYKKWRDTRK